MLCCKQRSKYRLKGCASLFCIYRASIWSLRAGISFPVKYPWNQVFYISIKVLSLCSLALSMAIITMAPNSLIMPTPNISPPSSPPLQTPYRAHAALSWTLAISPQPIGANQRAVCTIIRVRDRLCSTGCLYGRH